MSGENLLIVTMLGWVIVRLEVVAAIARKGERHAESPHHPAFFSPISWEDEEVKRR